MKLKHQRLVFVALAVVLVCAGVLVVMQSFRENLVFFYTPSELLVASPEPGRVIRLGGQVAKGSVVQQGEAVHFVVTDGAASRAVEYHGVLPSLFREGQGVVAEGPYATGTFQATRVLAKHDENYMPPEVAEKLKQEEHWHGGAAP